MFLFFFLFLFLFFVTLCQKSALRKGIRDNLYFWSFYDPLKPQLGITRSCLSCTCTPLNTNPAWRSSCIATDLYLYDAPPTASNSIDVELFIRRIYLLALHWSGENVKWIIAFLNVRFVCFNL